ncbi:sulfate transporter [Schizosaccharomyces japonicus yFS275]|uniref:Sulfate transporter n=1 Tax=Schizosaccharomyces japonicus (strain yFS275 / FY16936) TaxID=402676 RepID=B6JWV2_SCHJY|nr:sulfate transporter [Schizosaccharomyces japonicus yFS275]EEB05853.2 sulfate transporter [Schizosaccharomyces japonicus yFS275]
MPMRFSDADDASGSHVGSLRRKFSMLMPMTENADGPSLVSQSFQDHGAIHLQSAQLAMAETDSGVPVADSLASSPADAYMATGFGSIQSSPVVSEHKFPEREPSLGGRPSRVFPYNQAPAETEENERRPLLSYAPETDNDWNMPNVSNSNVLSTDYTPRRWHERARMYWKSSHEFMCDSAGPSILISNIPAVLIGLLLNILDALSYGMILFPLTSPVFSKLGPDGIACFYVSCIVSQLVFSFGGSCFKGSVGSEMVEVIPFFHQIAFTVLARVGPTNPTSVIATTIMSYSLSSVMTGVTFYLLGRFRLGRLIEFFPRHILVGCIGGVGYFLFSTAIEVSSRMEGNMAYDWATLKFLFSPSVFLHWAIPLVLALGVELAQSRWRHPFLVPAFFVFSPLIFFTAVSLIPGLTIQDLRDMNWIFQAPESNEPWYHFWTLFNIKETNWHAILDTVPEMMALTFFGILHVPINVPALAISTGQDDVDTDKELISHGISNGLSGLIGSIQNYMAYTNSFIFIRSGGNNRLAGVMLAIATAGVLYLGPVVIGYIPIWIVGALIFLLGIELLKESLIDTIGTVTTIEYITIVAIVATMGIMDFVFGIVLGIILACFFFVIQASRRSAVRGIYSGNLVRSTVRRPANQQRYLSQAGSQIQVCKLSGFMFFGTINGVESTINNLIKELSFSKNRLRYLIIDFSLVYGADFSVVQSFQRIRRLLSARDVQLCVCGLDERRASFKTLCNICFVGEDNSNVQVFETVNNALEYCENMLLKAFNLYRNKLLQEQMRINHLEMPKSASKFYSSDAQSYSPSPRLEFLRQAAVSTLQDESQELPSIVKYARFEQPFPLIMQVFNGLTTKNEDLWLYVCPHFKKSFLQKGDVLWHAGTPANRLCIVESGMLKALYNLSAEKLSENITGLCVVGELPFMCQSAFRATVTAEMDSVVWSLDMDSWKQLSQDERMGKEIINEFLLISLKLTQERISVITNFALNMHA